jgi:hypothetical protein
MIFAIGYGCVEELKITQSSQRTLSALRRGGEEFT